MRRLFDVTSLLVNSNDEEVHRTRGESWESRTKDEFESRKEKAKEMFRNRRPETDIFRVAQIVKLPVMVVREVEAEYLEEIKRKGGNE